MTDGFKRKTIDVSVIKRENRKSLTNVYHKSTNTDVQDVEQEPIPLELRPFLKLIVRYGKQTNSMGVMNAISKMEYVSRELKTCCQTLSNNQHVSVVDKIRALCEYIDSEVSKSRASTESLYNDDD